MIKIRKAQIDDKTLLTKIIRESFIDVAKRFNLTHENCPKHPSNCAEEWIINDYTRGVKYFILESNNIPVGCVALENPNTDQCYLERLAVLPEQRRLGFGKALVEHIFTQAKNLNVKEVGIGIIHEHEELKKWYEKIGFTEYEVKKFNHLPFTVSFMSYHL